MTFHSWLLALHVLSAFAFMSSLVLFWILVVAIRNVDTVGETVAYGRLASLGNKVVIAGSIGTLVFGIWLAIELDRYKVTNGWIVLAIVLWLIAGATGGRAGKEYGKAVTRAEELQRSEQEGQPCELRGLNRSHLGLMLHTVASIAALLILVDMIWKPGA